METASLYDAARQLIDGTQAVPDRPVPFVMTTCGSAGDSHDHWESAEEASMPIRAAIVKERMLPRVLANARGSERGILSTF